MLLKKGLFTFSSIILSLGISFVSFGASTEVIQEIQQLLNDQGYDCGTPDGQAGAKTIGAIAQYQEDHGLEIIGEASDAFLETLKAQDSSSNVEEEILSASGKTEEELQAEISSLQAELEDLQKRKKEAAHSTNSSGDSDNNGTDPNAPTWELKAGYYYAGIDIPAGKFDATALSGAGNLSSSNMFNGGVNEMFGIDTDSDWYIDSYKGIKLPEGEYLNISSNLTVKLDYKTITAGASGRKFNEEKAFDLSSGNYTSGEEFTPGIYNIVAVSGLGNLSSSNMYEGGLNEMFGVDADNTGWYIREFDNVSLPEGTDLEVAGITIKMIPAADN